MQALLVRALRLREAVFYQTGRLAAPSHLLAQSRGGIIFDGLHPVRCLGGGSSGMGQMTLPFLPTRPKMQAVPATIN